MRTLPQRRVSCPSRPSVAAVSRDLRFGIQVGELRKVFREERGAGPVPRYCSPRCQQDAFEQRRVFDGLASAARPNLPPEVLETIAALTKGPKLPNFSPKVLETLAALANGPKRPNFPPELRESFAKLTKASALVNTIPPEVFEKFAAGAETSHPALPLEVWENLAALTTAPLNTDLQEIIDRRATAIQEGQEFQPHPIESTPAFKDFLRQRTGALAEDCKNNVAAPDPLTTVIGLLREILDELRAGR